MSLNLALSSAVSSLVAVQKQMAVASNNIANANTVGYSKETVNIVAQVAGGVGTGVTDTGITTSVDQYLLSSVVSATTQAAKATAYSSYYQDLQQALGTITSSATGGNDLASETSTLETALNSLAVSPEQSSLKTRVVTALDNVCSTLRATSSSIQDLRIKADQAITDTVNDANTQLATINTLNGDIARAKAMNEPTASFEDQRNTALQALSQDLGVSYYVDGNDAMQIYTSGGQPLLAGNAVSTLSHTSNSAITNGTTYAAGGISGITLRGQDITSALAGGGGKLQALIAQRDVDLPNAQSELDMLASTLSTTVNAAYNTGSPNPPTATVTGTNAIPMAAADPISATAATVTLSTGATVTATIRLALVDSSGSVKSYADIDLSGATTVQAVINAINGAGYSGAQTVSASLSASGQLVLASSNASYGVAVATETGAAIGSASASTNFSALFHLNDLVSGGTMANTISVASRYLSTPSSMDTAKLNTTSATTPFTALTAGDGSVATAVSNALQAAQTIAAAGYLGASHATLATYATDIIADIANRASTASDSETTKSTTLSTLQASLSSGSGVNTDEETADLVTLQNLYAASAKVVSTVQAMFQALLTAVQA